MQDINQLITQNFQKNTIYFQSSHPKLFEKLSAYENAVENGHYNEKYELVFENGSFDIYEKQTQNYLYKKEPLSFSKLLLESVEYSRQNSVIIASKELDNSLVSKNMIEIEKFIFFGVGNGTHIVDICNKVTPKSSFIVEDDLELFRLSLMSVDYSLLAQKSELYFAIFEEDYEFKRSSELFLQQQFFYNYYIKFLQLPAFSEKKLQQFHIHTTTQSHFNFSYKSILEQYTRPLYYLQNKFNFLNILNTQLPTMPTLLVAPGPSLSKHIKWLQVHQENFLLIALSATLPTLQKHGICADIITHIDGFERSKKHFDSLESLDFIEDTPLLFSARTPQSIVEMFDKSQVFLFENGTNFKENFGNFSAFCAGSSSYLLSLILGVEELYLLGLDLAVDQKTLQTHSQEYQYNLELKEQEKDSLSFRDSLVQIRGNFCESVKTTPNFTLSINAIDEITQGLKTPKQKVYNLNDGAYFKGVEPLEVTSVNIKNSYDKKALKKEVLKLFTKKSEITLTQTEKDSIEVTKQKAKKVQKIIKSMEVIKIKDKNTLKNQLIQLTQMVTKEEQETLSLVLKTYCFTYYPPIFNKLNKNVEMNYQEEFDKLVQDLLRIATTYIKALNE